jgi:hypothetical protein
MINRITHRGRVAVLWAAQLRRDNAPRAQERALALLRQNAEWLQNCQKPALEIARNDSEPPEHARIVSHYFWITAETWLAVGEAERDQQRVANAARAFQNAKTAIDYLGSHATRRAIPLHRSRFDELRTRLRSGLRDTMANQDHPR